VWLIVGGALQTETEILVIGGGIAGLSAALAAARLGRRVHAVTGITLGGHLLSIEKIEGYPGFVDGVPGYDLCPIVQEQAAGAGAEFAMSEVTRIDRHEKRWRVEAGGDEYLAEALIVATGTSLKGLGVPGEEQLRGHGVSQCASCDAPLLAGKPVIVIGGGDSAAQEALALADHAASVAILTHGRALTAQRSFIERIEQHARIRVQAGTEIEAVLGEAAVIGVRARDLESGETYEVEGEGVFVYIGLEPKTECVVDWVDRDRSGYIVTDERLLAEVRGIFAAGTVRARAAVRAVAAAGEGTRAALAADEFLSK
jgi:thioredoxin reductase (NADPH)